jgi:hypothetical protein
MYLEDGSTQQMLRRWFEGNYISLKPIMYTPLIIEKEDNYNPKLPLYSAVFQVVKEEYKKI